MLPLVMGFIARQPPPEGNPHRWTHITGRNRMTLSSSWFIKPELSHRGALKQDGRYSPIGSVGPMLV